MANYPAYSPYMPQYGAQQPQTMPQMPQQAYQAPPAMPVQNQSPVYQMRPVTCDADMYSMQVDFSGTPLFGWDMAHGCIYMRQFNVNTGSADFAVFRRDVPQKSPEYVTVQQLNERLQEIERRLDHDQSSTKSDEDTAQSNAYRTDDGRNAKRRKSDADRDRDGE